MMKNYSENVDYEFRSFIANVFYFVSGIIVILLSIISYKIFEYHPIIVVVSQFVFAIIAVHISIILKNYLLYENPIDIYIHDIRDAQKRIINELSKDEGFWLYSWIANTFETKFKNGESLEDFYDTLRRLKVTRIRVIPKNVDITKDIYLCRDYSIHELFLFPTEIINFYNEHPNQKI